MAVSTHQSLQRAVAILREFTELDPSLTVSEISNRLDLHKSTVSRILSTLLEDGMVWHNDETGRYSLGMALVEMAGVALGQIDVRAASMPHMEHVAEATGETVSVLVQRGRDAVTVVHVPSRHPVQHVVWIGRRLPLRTSTAGRVLLAAMHAHNEDWRQVVGMPGSDRPAEWESTLATELEAIWERGCAIEADTFEIGTAAVAAPIMGHDGATTAVLSVSGPSARFDESARHQAVSIVMRAAATIATDMGLRIPVSSTKGRS